MSTDAALQRFRRHIATLWLGQVLSSIGDRLHEVALVWIAVESVGERAGLVVAAGAVARLAFGFAGGALADRWDRQRSMIGCDLARAAAVATLVVADLQGPGGIYHLAAVAFVLGVLDALFQPALQASLPALAPDIERLQAANAWLDITRRLAAALGPSATGLLLALVPLQHFFGIDALTFVLSALAIRTLGRGYLWRAAPAAGARGSLVSEIRGAWRLVMRERRLLFGLGQVAVWNLGLSPALQLGVALLVTGEFDGGPALLGYATGAYGVGNVASNLVLTRVRVKRTSRLLHLGGLTAALGWIAVASSTQVPVLLVMIALTALGGPMTDLMLLRLIQTQFPVDQIGKVFSFRYTISRAANGLGLMLAVPVYATLGVRAAIAISGLVLAAYALAALAAVAAGVLDPKVEVPRAG